MKLKIEQTLPLRPVGASLLSKDRIIFQLHENWSPVKTGISEASCCYMLFMHQYFSSQCGMCQLTQF